MRIVKSLTFRPHRRRRQRGEPSRRIRLRPGGSTPARRLHMQKLVRSRQNLHCAAHVCFSGPCGGVQRPRSARRLSSTCAWGSTWKTRLSLGSSNTSCKCLHFDSTLLVADRNVDLPGCTSIQQDGPSQTGTTQLRTGIGQEIASGCMVHVCAGDGCMPDAKDRRLIAINCQILYRNPQDIYIGSIPRPWMAAAHLDGAQDVLRPLAEGARRGAGCQRDQQQQADGCRTHFNRRAGTRRQALKARSRQHRDAGWNEKEREMASDMLEQCAERM